MTVRLFHPLGGDDRLGGQFWAVDFFSVNTVTTRGLKDIYVLVWVCITTREVIVSESTLHPDSAWVEKQADLFCDQTAGHKEILDIVMHDKDTKFTRELTAKLKPRGVRTNSLPKASLNLNGRCERFIETIKLEKVDSFDAQSSQAFLAAPAEGLRPAIGKNLVRRSLLDAGFGRDHDARRVRCECLTDQFFIARRSVCTEVSRLRSRTASETTGCSGGRRVG